MLTLCVLLSMGLGALALYAWHREQVWRHRMAEWGRAAGASAAVLPADLSELLRSVAAERAELGQEAHWRRLFESLLNEIRQGVLLVDRDLQVRFANHASAQLFQRPTIHRKQSLIGQVQEEQVVETVRTALAEGRHVMRQIRLSNSDRLPPVERHYLVESAPLPAEAERVAWLMVQDITESILSERIRQDFVVHASHELRTPLTVIQGYIETLKGGVIDEPAAAARCLTIMENHGKRLVRILEDLLIVSRLEGKDSPLNIEPFNLRACVQDAIDHLAPMLDNREVVFNLDFPADGGTLHGDRFYWDQLLTNLLENAVKDHPDRHLTIKIAARWQDGRCQLMVSDDGASFAASETPFVFKPFFHDEKRLGQAIKGTGLGLAIVHRIVEAHGGRIDLQSSPGLETRFTIELPARLPLAPIDAPVEKRGVPSL